MLQNVIMQIQRKRELDKLSTLKDKNLMKFRAHDTFCSRKGWLEKYGRGWRDRKLLHCIRAAYTFAEDESGYAVRTQLKGEAKPQ